MLKFHEKTIPVVEKNARLFVPTGEMIGLADLTNIKKKGYASLDAYCTVRGLDIQDHFVFSGNQISTKCKRLFISVDLLSDYLRIRDDDLSQILGHKLTSLKAIKIGSPGDFVNFKDDSVSVTHGIFHCSGKDISFKMVGELVFLLLKDFVSAFAINKQLKTDGHSFLDKHLKKQDIEIDSVFLGNGRCRTYIKADAVVALINANAFKHAENTGKELMTLLLREVAVSASVKKQICTPKRTALQKHVEVKMPPKKAMERKSQRSLFKTNPKKKKGAALIKETLMQLFQTQFGGDTDSFLKAFSGIFVAKGKEEFDGTVPMKELSSMLSSRTIKRAKTETNLLDTLVSQTAPQVYKLSALESIYYADNLSGRRLTERYRQRLPGVFPSARAERLTKRNLKDIFSYVLLPRRTPSGWKLDLSRLIEVLGFQYYLLDSEVKHWKIHGDGREIAKRHSTFISLNILNNDAVLHGVNFQSPDHVYPFQVFYDSDSRDNIEVNMGYGLLDSLTTGNTFYLGGDEMFLESILDGSSILSPTSDEGWNIYSKCTKKSRSDTGTDGLRTSLGKTIDRGHPESFFGDAIPTNRIVFCLLHATARSVEKLLALEVANVLSEANKQNEKTAGQGDAYRQTAIGNLETNISRRGVRNGNFKLEFNKSGSPEPISLNKDNALLILHPDDESFPHPLKGVLPARSVTVNLPTSIRNKLGIPEKYSEFELVKTMWNCLWKMLKILRKDDMPATGSN